MRGPAETFDLSRNHPGKHSVTLNWFRLLKMPHSDSDKYFGVSSTRASMFARLLPTDANSGGSFSNADWNRFIEKYTPLIYGVCRQFHLQKSDAEDVSQNAILTVLQVLREGKFTYDSRLRFRSWLATVIQNSVLESLRRTRRYRTAGSDFPDVAADHELADKIHQQVSDELLLGMALESVERETRADHWKIFDEVFLKQRTAPDLSSELGISTSNIYVICNRIRSRVTDKCTQLSLEGRLA
jgi:RNA polymerase sigma factor (sigma-70 family)